MNCCIFTTLVQLFTKRSIHAYRRTISTVIVCFENGYGYVASYLVIEKFRSGKTENAVHQFFQPISYL